MRADALYNQAEEYARMLGRGNLPLQQFFREASKMVHQDQHRARIHSAEARFRTSSVFSSRSGVLDLSPVIGGVVDQSITNPGSVSTPALIRTKNEGLVPLLPKQCDNARQRLFLDQLPLFHPSTWYTPHINNKSCIGIRTLDYLSEGLGFGPKLACPKVHQPRGSPLLPGHKQPAFSGRDGYRSLDASLLSTFEWHSDCFEGAIDLITHEAKDRRQKSGRILLGRSEAQAWQRNEVDSLTPIRNERVLVELLGDILDPLPEEKIQRRGGISTQEISIIRRLAPRRPMRLYPLLIDQHPVKVQLDIAKETMARRRNEAPQIWIMTATASGKFGYVQQPVGELEASVTSADKNRVDKECGTDDVANASKDIKTADKTIDVTIEHSPPEFDISGTKDNLENKRVQGARQKMIIARLAKKWQTDREEIQSVTHHRVESEMDGYRPLYFERDGPHVPRSTLPEGGLRAPPLASEPRIQEGLKEAKEEVKLRMEDYRTLMFNKILSPILDHK